MEANSNASAPLAASPPCGLAVPGTVYFIGAGPGAPDLITVRGQTIIAQADLVLYADSLVQASVAHLASKPGVQIVGSSDLHLEQQVALMVESAQSGSIVARVHTGDPALYGAIHEQMVELDAHGIPYEVVPGVTAAFAAAARLGVELTLPELVQTVIFSRISGRTPVPEREALHTLAAHGASLVLYLSVSQIEQVVAELLAGGVYTPQTPVVVVHKVTWPDESIVMGTLADIAEKVRSAGYTRHALILVSPALAPAVGGQVSNLPLPPAPSLSTRSRLYDRTFSHGCREAEVPGEKAKDEVEAGFTSAPTVRRADVKPAPTVVIVAVTKHGTGLAVRLAEQLDADIAVPERFAGGVEQSRGRFETCPYPGSVVNEIRRRWGMYRQFVLIMATGVAVRAIAPLLMHKTSDPAVVCLDEAGHSVIPLLGGHQAGANDLARQIAAMTEGYAAITTASDVQGKPALDLLGKDAGWRIDPSSALTHASACLVNGDLVGGYVDPAIAPRQELAADNLVLVEELDELQSEEYAAGLIITHRILSVEQRHLLQKSVLYRPPVLVVGVGSRRGVSADELRSAIETTLKDAHLALDSIVVLATADMKADEPGIQQVAADLGVPLQIVEQKRLAELDPAAFSPSAAQEAFGVAGVAEPCAVLAAGGDRSSLLVPKRSFATCTVAVALEGSGKGELGTASREPGAAQRAASSEGNERGLLALISLGPGDAQQMTLGAREALNGAEVVIGYQMYIEQIRPLLSPQQEVIARPMKSEIERAEQAIDLAVAGRRVALVSSGDIGMYAMAGPVFEVLHQRGWQGSAPEVQVFPGVSAFQAAAARLGAAINHDLCTISLSDLLTPWEVIERRLWASAAGDFVVALYNPRSKGRDWQLGRARDILLRGRPNHGDEASHYPVALVRNVTRPDESVTLTTLAELDPHQADMLTVVLVGNSQSYRLGEYLVTPRGYAGKDLGGQNAESGKVAEAPVSDGLLPATYPITLTQMKGAVAVVVGGGQVGERKIGGLLAVGATVQLISPDATPRVQAWAAEGAIQYAQRPYQAGDLAHRPALVFAATDQREINAQVAQEASALSILCNVADAPGECTFHLPAVHREDGLVVAVSTEGTSPSRARQVRDQIADWMKSGSQPVS